MRALKEADVWETTSNWVYYSKSSEEFVISGSKRDAKYYDEEILHLRVKQTDVEKGEFSATLDFVIGGDVVYDKYETDSGAFNSMHITKLDTVNKTISGYFNVKLNRSPHYVPQKSIQFTSGVFSLKYEVTD
jgi:hypothetical protein